MTQATVPLRAAVPAATSHLVSADLPLPLIGAASAAVDTVAGVAVLGAASSQAIAFVGNKQVRLGAYFIRALGLAVAMALRARWG
jgi:hypothetical protein